MSTAQISNLSIGIGVSDTLIIDDASLSIEPGEIIGLVGETGSGKSTIGLSLLGYLSPGLSPKDGVVRVGEEETINAEASIGPAQLRALRGKVVSYVPQDPGPSLNPRFRLERTFLEHMRAHNEHDELVVVERRRKLFEAVGLPTDTEFAKRFPHELSGGQQQRVAIALAFAHSPSLVVMDEPTTGLDAATKNLVVALIHDLARTHNAGIIFISHDLELLIRATNRLVVLYHGRIVENIASASVESAAKHPYTQRLVRSLTHTTALTPIAETETTPVLATRELSVSYGKKEVVQSVSLAIAPGETLGIVGESGSGKTTLARAIAGLHPQHTGTMTFAGDIVNPAVARRTAEQRQKIQYVFQNPWSALNPRRTVGASAALAARRLLGVTRSEAQERTIAAFQAVGLRSDHADAFPQRLSGGQRQRAALARALVSEPTLLICDEVTSSLDLTVQAEIVDLLRSLQESRKLAMLFITHDLNLAASIAHRSLVLYQGEVVEEGPSRQVLTAPSHPYTIGLVAHGNAGRASFLESDRSVS